MMRPAYAFCASILLALLVATAARADEATPPGEPRPAASTPTAAKVATRFVTVDLTLATGENRLAAWQVELRYDPAQCAVVGLERGGATGYAADAAPTYDPRGLTEGRLIIADLSLAEDLPAGAVRVARLHLELRGDAALPTILAITAADPDGKTFTATATLKESTK